MAGYGTGKITKESFDCTKKLIETGEQKAKIARWMNLSHNTINNIAKSETLEEYRELVNVQRKGKKAPEKTVKQAQPELEKPQIRELPPPMASAYQINRLIENQNKQIELLTLISRKLAFIVEELTGTTEAMTK